MDYGNKNDFKTKTKYAANVIPINVFSTLIASFSPLCWNLLSVTSWPKNIASFSLCVEMSWVPDPVSIKFSIV